MANYRAGDVIRLTRLASGMTQEELSDGICSVETLSRIENGKHSVKKETYELLMSRMERNPLKNYAVCTGKDMEILEEQVLFETAMTKNDIKLAGYYLKIIKNKMSDTISDRQYVARVEGIYNYKTGQIDAEEYVKCMDRAIRITAPHYEEYLEDTEHRVIYPFTELELYTLMSLANACVKNGQKNKSIQIYDKLLTCLEAGYMDTCSTVKLQMLIHRNYIKVLGEVGEHHLAIKKAQELLMTAKLNNYGSMLPVILGEIVWNQQMICKKEGRDIKKSADAKRKLLQAYYIAAARKDFADVEIIREHFRACFGEEIE